ncbi:unnamed protein product, partial [Acanthocheilonema viteae]
TQLRTRARRCVCIFVSCGCYQPSDSVYRQPLPTQYRQPIYRQQSNASPCMTNCIQSCMQNQRSACQQSCQNSCGIQSAYQHSRGPTSYQYEPLLHEVANGQQSAGGTCINICMPGCESQCIERTTPIPVVPQHNSPIPVIQSQTPSYYASQQYEPAIQQSSNNDNILCIHLCMPSCESQCIQRTTSAIPPYAERTEQPNAIYYSKQTSYSPSSHQNFIQTNQKSIIVRPQYYSGTATICIPICMPSCEKHCTENQGESGAGEEYTNGGGGGGGGGGGSGGTEEPVDPAQTDLLPHEISINLPQSIQQSPDCMNLCHETCLQQCIGQNQPEDQCRPSCFYTCQESCAQSPANTATASSVQQPQVESEVHETMTQTSSDNSMNPPLFKTFLLRSPPYYRQTKPQVINCLPDSARIGHCKCPFGYVTCLSTKSGVNKQQCCKKWR